MSYQPPAIERYLWLLSRHQPLVNRIERSLKVHCTLLLEQQMLIFLDEKTLIPVVYKKISTDPKADLNDLAAQWSLKIHIFKVTNKLAIVGES